MPVSLLSPPRLTYQYGWSFLLLVMSFLSCEAAGVSGIFLYMHHHQYRYLCRQDGTRIGVHLLKNLAAPLTGADQLTKNGDIIREAIHKAADELEQQEEHEDTRDMSRFLDHKHIPTMTVAEINKRRDSGETNLVWAVGNGRLKGAQAPNKSLAVVDPFQTGAFPSEKTTLVGSHPRSQPHFHTRLNGRPKSSSGSPPKRRADMFLCARHRAASLRRNNRRVDLETEFLPECPAPPKLSRLHHPRHRVAQFPRISDGNSSQDDDDEDDMGSELTADGDDEDSFRALLNQGRQNNGVSSEMCQPTSHGVLSRNTSHINMDSFTNPSFFHPQSDSSRAHSAPSPFCPSRHPHTHQHHHHHPSLHNSMSRTATAAEGGLPDFHQCCQCVHCGFTLTNEGPSLSKTNSVNGVGGPPDPESFLSRASVMHSLVGPRKCLCEGSTHNPGGVVNHHLIPTPPLPHYPSDCGLYETGAGDPFYMDQDTRV